MDQKWNRIKLLSQLLQWYYGKNMAQIYDKNGINSKNRYNLILNRLNVM